VIVISPLSAPLSQSANALTYDELQGLTYLQVKGTGVANTCSVINGGSSDLKVGSHETTKYCALRALAH
jgi:photosystem II oxygen-evolving enhancer protein 1